MCRVADWAFLGVVFVGVMARAQAPANTSALTLAATSDSAGAIKIDVLRWSTDAERDQLLSAWTRPSAPAPVPAGGGRGGRGRGGAAAAPDPTDDAQQDAGAAAPAAAGRAGAGRGGTGRGGGRGGNAGAEPTAGSTPESSLAAALGNAPTVGYLWSAFEVSGYALRYAVRLPAQDGGERIVLITDRRLGAFNNLWKPTGTGTPANDDFSVIELHLNAKGVGEGRVSLTGKIKADAVAKTFALENYGDLPVTLKNVTPRKP
ncbi:MAG TPA: hypothetical protein VIY49_20575 [Bryobacteraceae bacterium]